MKIRKINLDMRPLQKIFSNRISVCTEEAISCKFATRKGECVIEDELEESCPYRYTAVSETDNRFLLDMEDERLREQEKLKLWVEKGEKLI